MNLTTDHCSPVTSGIGAIFDWDGVIVDSHDQHQESWYILARELGKPITAELFKESFGKRNEQIIPELFHWAEPEDHAAIAGLADRKEALYRQLVRASGIRPLPGVREFLAALNANTIPCSIGSSTPRENIDCVLELIGLEDQFAAVTAADDVTHGKPDPEVFLLAARKIDRPPDRCVVFEYAHVGIEAGRAAGMKTIAITTTHPRHSFDNADRVVDSLAEVTIEDLESLIYGK